MSVLSIVIRASLFSVIWWILADGDVSSWWIGVPAVSLAVSASIALVPPVSLVWHELFRFVFFFLTRSLMGGVDVAWRACHPGMPIAPDLVDYPLRLPTGPLQVYMVNTVNLLPGTLSAELDHGILRVHVLDRHKDFAAELEAVEQGLARMFGVSLNIDSGGG